ncbi:uncharacterized protein Z518_10937 [Rhinocladiella mackenziei CBS 650.93]|uniref:Rhinocladiella mackenziei CBS 650.93 unplaced genomic scaffold supercont1.10, whole genome shotgun sequence n=1 Tax=Rhinocladiella mackenziei CBS 650.93 TaxID=1442369 RepID=A0A0D2ITI2_9EURO|nr:uncharacterized protein Z518_10937 [Rhinocladiella mackenziei CBS 650.93]KIX00010.1 hypothetical protein Z518_10937 [Rhinocladiella mackenziei CBS 650.93]
MRRSPTLLFQSLRSGERNLIQIRNGTFYREHPATDHSQDSNPPLFPNLTFELPATIQFEKHPVQRQNQHWAVIGASGRTTFLEILRGSHICLPPNARSFPYLASDHIDDEKDHRLRIPSRAIQYVGFNNGRGQISGGGVRGAYLSARYESRREETDWSVLQYLKGDTELNPAKQSLRRTVDQSLLDKVISDLRLEKLIDMPVSNLSNGQTRRARIAKALLDKPLLLLLDDPFMGLDPPTLVSLSPMLKRLAYRSSPQILLGLRPQDPIPRWITHLVVLGQNHSVALMGGKAHVLLDLCRWAAVGSRIQSIQSDQVPAGHKIDSDVAEQIIAEYGLPPSGVGDILDERGISKHVAFDLDPSADLLQHPPDDRTLDPQGFSTEDETGLKSHQSRKARSQKTLDELLSLTITMPETSTNPQKHASALSSRSPPASSIRRKRDRDTRHEERPLGDPLIELSSVIVKYGDKTVLGLPPARPGFSSPGLNLSIRQGTRLALLGPNGSGKTTLLSLLTSDHPQSYSLPIKFFGRSRLPSSGRPGLSLWEIQSRIGHSSPEIHAFFPKNLPVRRVLESAWAETYAGKPKLTAERSAMVDAFLRWWERELRQDSAPATVGDHVLQQKHASDLEWAMDRHTHSFGVLPFAAQRLLLLLRAIIKDSDIIILDEAFSGLSADTRDRAMAWLEYGESSSIASLTAMSKTGPDPNSDPDVRFYGLKPTQALVVVSHVKEEIPDVVDEWLRLPSEEEVIEHGRSVEGGRTAKGEIKSSEGWMRVWGL